MLEEILIYVDEPNPGNIKDTGVQLVDIGYFVFKLV
jgi:hypothetical protein